MLGNALTFGLYEIFHHKTPMAEFESLIKKHFKNHKNFHDECQKNPILSVEKLFLHNPNPIFLYKLFPEHLSSEANNQLLNSSDAIILLKRNLLASWSSDQIASYNSDYVAYQENIEKNQMKIKFDIAVFVNYCKHVLDFIASTERFTKKNKIPTLEFSYKEILHLESSSKLIWEHLNSTIASKFQFYLNEKHQTVIKKQNIESLLGRFENIHLVEKELFKYDLDFFLENSDRFDTEVLLDKISKIQFDNGFYI